MEIGNNTVNYNADRLANQRYRQIQSRKFENGSFMQMRNLMVRKSLLDYCLISDQKDEAIPSFLYNNIKKADLQAVIGHFRQSRYSELAKGNPYSAGQSGTPALVPDQEDEDYSIPTRSDYDCEDISIQTEDGTLRQLRYCELIKEKYPYDESKLLKKDVWITKVNGISTRYIKLNKDKVNYLVQYYAERGGDMSTYPFENDSEDIQRMYKHSAEEYGFCVMEECRLRKAFEDAGIQEATISIDVKGEITVDTADEQADIEALKQSLKFERASTSLRNTIFSEGYKYNNLSSEEIVDTSAMYATAWQLYRYYGIDIDDLSIEKDGSISGLTDEVYEDYDCQTHTEFYGFIKKLIRRGGSSSDEIGRIMYKDGKLYVL